MCRQAAHRTCMDTQLSKGSLICEPYLLIPHALGERIAMRGFERTDRRATCWAATTNLMPTTSWHLSRFVVYVGPLPEPA